MLIKINIGLIFFNNEKKFNIIGRYLYELFMIMWYLSNFK